MLTEGRLSTETAGKATDWLMSGLIAVGEHDMDDEEGRQDKQDRRER